MKSEKTWVTLSDVPPSLVGAQGKALSGCIEDTETLNNKDLVQTLIDTLLESWRG